VPLSSPQTKNSVALRELLTGAIDYAGLFPPAALAMVDAVQEYAKQRVSLHAWALGRFVVGMEQLAAFVAARRALGDMGGKWPLSILVTQNAGPHGRDLSGDLDVLRVEAVEAKAASTAEVERSAWLRDLAPEVYLELPTDANLEPLVAAVRALGVRAKIRTGGVAAQAIPTAEAVARFMRTCADAAVPFKATAGLHHIVRGEYALTYAPDSPRAVMFGFLNVFVASALALQGQPVSVLVDVLQERSLRAFKTDISAPGELCWRGHCLTREQLSRARQRGIVSFGSCSFAEPIAELTQAGLVAVQ
jgi:hypothetical protein